jgi:hypothetical protein
MMKSDHTTARLDDVNKLFTELVELQDRQTKTAKEILHVAQEIKAAVLTKAESMAATLREQGQSTERFWRRPTQITGWVLVRCGPTRESRHSGFSVVLDEESQLWSVYSDLHVIGDMDRIIVVDIGRYDLDNPTTLKNLWGYLNNS